jgi:hypothetical protein
MQRRWEEEVPEGMEKWKGREGECQRWLGEGVPEDIHTYREGREDGCQRVSGEGGEKGC